MGYYIYHIEGKKIGATNNLKKRVEKEQGYREGEYKVVFTTDDLKEASDKEKELQILYGYPVDKVSYMELMHRNKHIYNRTATTTFRMDKNQLTKSYLVGLTLDTSFGVHVIDDIRADWILKNINRSFMSKNGSCYIYNKAMEKEFKRDAYGNVVGYLTVDRDLPNTIPQFELVREWAKERGLYAKGDNKTQMLKLMEEVGETARAILKEDDAEIEDGLGDILVVLINLSHLSGYKLEDCLASAYEVISKRKGKMINGTFVKDV